MTPYTSKSKEETNGLRLSHELVAFIVSSKMTRISQDLAAINALMRNEVEKKSGNSVGKRLLTDDLVNATESGPPQKIQIINQSQKVNTKLELILGNRFQAE